MDIAVFEAEELPIALRALWTVANANGSVTEAEQQLLATVAELHGRPAPALGPVGPDEVAGAIAGEHARKRLVQLAVVTAMVDGEPTPPQLAAVDGLARALGVADSSVRVLSDATSHSATLVRLDVMRRMAGGRVLGDDVYEKLGNLPQAIRAISGHGAVDADRAWRFKQLGLLPEGTLGREYWRFMTRQRFPFPGEPGLAILERLVFHDLGHVLAGYDTDPIGEIRQGAFQAGNRRDDGFVFLLFVLSQFHLGVTIQPAAPTRKGLFDPAAVLEALSRGAACKVDLTDHWDFWAVVERPVAELREEWGIPPIRHLGAGVQAGYRP